MIDGVSMERSEVTATMQTLLENTPASGDRIIAGLLSL